MNNGPFGVDEYLERVDNVRRLMIEQQIDGLFLTSGPNLRYLSGYPSGSPNLSRPMMLVLALEGDPVLFVQYGKNFEAAAYSWVPEVRTYVELSRAPVPQLVDTFHELGLGSGRVGAELGPELRLDIPFADFVRLQQQLHETQFVDAGPVLWAARMQKSEAEIALIREACQVTNQAYETVFQRLRAGMTEAEIARTMTVTTLKLGGGSPWISITSGQGNYELASGVPSQRKVEKGDMVWMDSGCCIGGYWSDCGRAGVVGGASREQARAQALIHEITMMGVEMIKPGIKASDIATACNAELAKEGKVGRLGLPVTSYVSGEASRIGHGVGLSVTEMPHIAEYDDTILEPNMVITV